jgi:two-component system chemotaxis response regulator CheB
MPGESRNAVVIGASAGGLDAVRTIIYSLPPNFHTPILVVIHTSPEAPGLLAAILDRVGPLRASTARPIEPLENGHIYVAPPDSHLTIDRGRIRLTRGPREHRFRPAIGPLFRSAAQHYRDRAIGIVLSGNMADGTHRLMTIKGAGGIAMVEYALETGALRAPPSPFTCPDCGGTLWELNEGSLVRYRCHVGHSFFF